MDQYELIRTAHRVYGKSIRQIQRETGHHRVTIRKALRGLEPKYRRVKPVRHPVMGPVAETVKRWLREDRERPVKQRHTARRIYTRLVEEEGFQGSETTVRRWVREWRASQGWGQREAVVPLDPTAMYGRRVSESRRSLCLGIALEARQHSHLFKVRSKCQRARI